MTGQKPDKYAHAHEHAHAPTRYDPKFVEIAARAYESGCTDAEVAHLLGVVDGSTLRKWAHQYPEFCAVLKAGKDAADERVIRSLYHRAVGYWYDDERERDGQTYTVRVHVPPDVTAQIFWLKNRRRAEWNDRGWEGNGNLIVELVRFSDQAVRQVDEVAIPALSAPPGPPR